MTDDFQRTVERAVRREGKVAGVAMGRRKTGYIFFREDCGFRWRTVRNGEVGDADVRSCPAFLRTRLFDCHGVKDVQPERVPGPVAALSRVAPVEEEEEIAEEQTRFG